LANSARAKGWRDCDVESQMTWPLILSGIALTTDEHRVRRNIPPATRDPSIKTWRLHQREQLVHGLDRDLTDALVVERPGNPDLPDHRVDFIAEVRKVPQRVFGIVGNACNQSRYQDLARNHPAVELFHDSLHRANSGES